MLERGRHPCLLCLLSSGSFVRPRKWQLTCKCVHKHFHFCAWDLKGEEGGGEGVCVCVSLGNGRGGVTLILWLCFSSSIHLSPQTIRSQSSKEQNLISTCGTELKDNETLSRRIYCWKAASSFYKASPPCWDAAQMAEAWYGWMWSIRDWQQRCCGERKEGLSAGGPLWVRTPIWFDWF